MQPRVLFRTHYQVDEPRLIEFVVKLCTSPVRSAYDEAVARKLSNEIGERLKEFNVAAAGYAVGLAQGLKVIDKNNVWSERGHLVSLLSQTVEHSSEKPLDLDTTERLLYFRLFMESDGAMIIALARRARVQKEFSNSETPWTKLATDLLQGVYRDYLAWAGTTADRVALRREADRITRRGYEGRSGQHKMFIHLQTLYRLGFLDRAHSRDRRYTVPADLSKPNLAVLLQELPDFYALERAINERRLIEIAGKVFHLGEPTQTRWPVDVIMPEVVTLYRKVMCTGVSLCPLSTIIEAIQIKVLAGRGQVIPNEAVMDALKDSQRENPREIRFHVDRKGQPAFLRLSDPVIERYEDHST